MNKPKLTVSIVEYNSGDYLLRLLQSLSDLKDKTQFEVYVVDNNSSDNSLVKAKKRFPKYHYIQNTENVGFGKAHNQVLSKLETEYVVVLNPDIILPQGVFDTLIDYLDSHKDVGAITPKIVLDDDKIDLTAHRGFPTPYASLLYFLGNDSLYHLTNRDMSKPHEVDAIMGAFLLTRKKVLEKSGAFDEDYFMYAEDIDLCFRIKQAGYKVIYYPEITVLHFKGISTGLKKHSQHLSAASKDTRLRSLNAFYETMNIFYHKHMQSQYPFFINWLVYLGINIRWWLAKRKLQV